MLLLLLPLVLYFWRECFAVSFFLIHTNTEENLIQKQTQGRFSVLFLTFDICKVWEMRFLSFLH
uniref:Uncharacterized protein n=1 Tax=Anguilla anguilla TaxID=7936 RepID=A0A0E9W814_ANGAN